ncbi:hypothetical protein BJF78_13495 [Pseudonocardia sp. CNS-139]|nr:hypothetical protein BJF78_13495 [Pseudonocardia sp. CNS-139]
MGVDNATSLIERARDEARGSGRQNVSFDVMDIGDLDFPDRTFDCVLSHFALNASFPPGVGAREAWRVLRPGGVLTFVMWGRTTRGGELTAILNALLKKWQPAELPAELAHVQQAVAVVPYGFFQYGPLAEPADTSRVMAFLRGLGFERVEAVTRYLAVEYADVDALLTMVTPLRIPLRQLSPDAAAGFREDMARAVGPLFDSGDVAAECEVMCFTARKPGGS